MRSGRSSHAHGGHRKWMPGRDHGYAFRPNLASQEPSADRTQPNTEKASNPKNPAFAATRAVLRFLWFRRVATAATT